MKTRFKIIMSLRTKLTLSYVLVALICVALISVITNFLLDNQFKEYIKKNQMQKNKEVVASVTQQYQDSKKWNIPVVESIGVSALEKGLIIKVKDGDGKMIWDATVHNNGMCQNIIKEMANNMNQHYPELNGGYVEKSYPITYDSNDVGSVSVGYYGPFYLSDNDLAFINVLNKLLLAIGIFSLLFALVVGMFMAKRLSMPITRVIKTAQMIAKGCFNSKVSEKSTTKEICQLTDTVNNLASTLERQELLRKRLTADVAHELRTPISTLQSHLEAMIDGIWEADTERLKSCHEEIIRLGRMVGDLEKLAKFESENLILSKTEFDVSELVKRILQNFETDFMSKNIEMKFVGQKEIVCADRDKISQVVVNLLSNALKYTPSGGRVEVKIKNDENNTKIMVKDNGVGISEEDIPYVFERFYRADKSRNKNTGGAGIGSTIAKAIVEAHGGKIELKSKLNEGTEFRVLLPKKEIKNLCS